MSKKSVESVWSPGFPKSRSQLEDTGNPTADRLIEPPNGWPVSAHSSTWSLGSLENGSCNNLQGLDALARNQTFEGALLEDATWDLQREVQTFPSLPSVPPPTDMSSVPNPDGFLWRLFTTDNDWQIDFNDRFITEPTSAVLGATPIALNELDLSQSYYQLNQDLESPGLPRGLAEYFSLGGKVSANATILTHISSFIQSFAN